MQNSQIQAEQWLQRVVLQVPPNQVRPGEAVEMANRLLAFAWQSYGEKLYQGALGQQAAIAHDRLMGPSTHPWAKAERDALRAMHPRDAVKATAKLVQLLEARERGGEGC